MKTILYLISITTLTFGLLVGCTDTEADIAITAETAVEPAAETAVESAVETSTETTTKIATKAAVEKVTEAVADSERVTEATADSETETITEKETSAVTTSETTTETKTIEVKSNTIELNSPFTTASDLPFEFNLPYLEEAKSLEYPSPYIEITPINYQPSDTDIVQYDQTLHGLALFDSMTHKGYTGDVLDYTKNKVQWNDFFDDLDHTANLQTVTITLRNESIHEIAIVDENEIYHRFYDEYEGIYYEVSELMIGNYTDENAVLTKQWAGMSCMYSGFDGLEAPTHNPFKLKKIDEFCINSAITQYQDQPCVFFETLTPNQYSQYWVSIENGITLKRIAYNSDGLPEEIDLLQTSKRTEVEDSVFHQPYDVDFMDITMFIFAAEHSAELEAFGDAIMSLLPEDPFSMTLTSNQGDTYDIHSGGFSDSIGETIYVRTEQDINDQEVTLRSYTDEGMYTVVCDERDLAILYGSSAFEKKFFDFKKTGFAGFKQENEINYYTFRDMGKGSVSGLIDFYQYQVNTQDNTLVGINTFHKESLTTNEHFGDVSTYTITSFGQVNESLFGYPETYNVIDHGPDSHNDGEHVPAWFQ